MRNFLIFLVIFNISLTSYSKKKSGDVNHTETNHENDRPLDQNANQDAQQGDELEEDAETGT